MTVLGLDLRNQLKERLELNSGTRSLIIAIFASVYIPLAFVSSYFGMNASGFTDGGLTSTNTFWKVSIPLVIGSIIIPIAFSGLLLRKIMQAAFSAKALFIKTLRDLTFLIVMIVTLFSVFFDSTVGRIKTRRNEEGDGQKRHQSSPDNNERVSDQNLEMA